MEGVPQQYLGDLLTMATWMSQKGSKTSVNGLYPQYVPFMNRLEPTYEPLILTSSGTSDDPPGRGVPPLLVFLCGKNSMGCGFLVGIAELRPAERI